MKPLQYYSYFVAALTLACFLLLFIESVPYLRFIISTLHINLVIFQFLLLVLWLPLLVKHSSFSIKLLIITLIVCVVGESAAKTSLAIFRELRNISTHPFLSYDQKMTLAYHNYTGFYPAMKMVTKLTPPNATILLPPQRNPWEVEGNATFVAYFLYPRQVQSLKLDTTMIPHLQGPVYVLIARGSWEQTGEVDHGWPKIPVASKRVWQIDTNRMQSTISGQNYDPDRDNWSWGLIEVKYD